MTTAGRVAAVLAGLVCMVLAAVELVRQAVLAAGDDVAWPVSSWWADLTGDPSWTTTGAAAAVLIVVAVVLIVVAVRQLSDVRRGPELVEFATDEGRARLSVPGIEQTLARRFESLAPGVRVTRLDLTRQADGWRVRVEASLPGRDLEGMRRRALAVMAEDLERLGGLDLVRLDLVVAGTRA